MLVHCFLEICSHFLLDVSSYLSESRGGPEGSGGKSIPIASICKYIDMLLVSPILQT